MIFSISTDGTMQVPTTIREIYERFDEHRPIMSRSQEMPAIAEKQVWPLGECFTVKRIVSFLKMIPRPIPINASKSRYFPI